MKLNKISELVIGAAIEVYKQLGPGLLELTYQKCLYYELKQRRFRVSKEVPGPLVCEDIHLEHGYRIDVLIKEQLVVEIKIVECFTDVHFVQFLIYIKPGGYKPGLLLNCNVPLLRNGISEDYQLKNAL